MNGAQRSWLRLRCGLFEFFCADVVGGEEGQEGSAGSGGFDGGTAVCFLAFDDADYCGDDHAGFAGGFESSDGGTAGGAHVVDDDDARARLKEAFNAAAGSVGFLGFADKEAVDERGGGIGKGAIGAGSCDVGDDGVSTHGEPADGVSMDIVGFEKIKDGVAGEAATLGMEGGGAAVDVVIAGGAGGEGEGAEAEAQACDVGEELLGVCWGGHRI